LRGLAALGVVVLSVACDRAPTFEALPAATVTAASATPTASAPGNADGHDAHDCSVAHPDQPRPPASTATVLSAQARARADTLRISARVGNVTLRKTEQGWAMSGQPGCLVPEARMRRAFDVLGKAAAQPSPERPAAFELQIVVQSGEELLLHFDVADRRGDKDLVQLIDGSTVRIRGLDRRLLVPDPSAWCEPSPGETGLRSGPPPLR
jgi:hypothetical protein